jgi:fructosamine-3-kinase
VPVYQLYFLLAHVNLFGASYVPQVAHAVGALTR